MLYKQFPVFDKKAININTWLSTSLISRPSNVLMGKLAYEINAAQRWRNPIWNAEMTIC